MVRGKYVSTLIVCLLVWLTSATAAMASRYVKVEVLLDGKVILIGSASDDGRRDADELWEVLKSVNLKATADFQKLDVSKDVKELVIKSTALGEHQNVKIVMRYGGTAEARELKVHRIAADEYGGEWRIAADDVDRLSDDRLISRWQVRMLKDPKRKREKSQ